MALSVAAPAVLTERVANDRMRLKTLDAAKSRFFANASHELRTPLVSLNSTVQMMLDEGVKSERQASLLRSSQQALEDMLENVNDILLKARSEKGKVDARWSEIEVASFVDRALSVFRPLSEKRGVALRLENELPEGLQAFVDRRHLKKILNNLVGNAMKFTEEGEVTVTLRGGDKSWQLAVRDTGKGIPEEELPTMFDAFVQASNNLQREAHGTGLGLALVRDLVELQHGSIKAESTLGEGSCFTVTLPLGDGHVDYDKLDSSEISVEKDERVNLKIKSFEELDLSPFEEHKPGRPRVLLVEDTPAVLQVLAYALKDDHNLYFAKNGQEGLERMRELQPDLVVSDIMMPVKNGYELTKEMKDDPTLRRIPLILLTSKADTESRIEGFEAGADEYLSKPFVNHEVRVRIRGLLERKKIEAEAIHAEKLASIGVLAAGMAHEINNPIACIQATAPLLQQMIDRVRNGKMKPEKAFAMMNEGITDIYESSKRVSTLTLALKGHVHPGTDATASHNLEEEIDKTLSILTASAQGKMPKVVKEYALEAEVPCSINHMNQVWMNLMQNAVDALGDREDATLTIRTRQSQNYAYLEFMDNGPGIPEEHRGSVFDLFFTTKSVGKGTGMGLFLCRKIVEEHGGLITIDDAPGGGALFTIKMPLTARKRPDGRVPSSEFSITEGQGDKKIDAVQYPQRLEV